MSYYVAGAQGPAGPAGAAGAAGANGSNGGGGLMSAGGINSYFDLWQPQDPAGALVDQGGYNADGWIVESENGGADTLDRGTGIIGGTNSNHWLRLNKVGTGGKMMIMQPFSTDDSLAWIGISIATVCDMESDDGGGTPIDLNLGIFSWLSSGPLGTDNEISRPIVNAWNGAGVDPTWNADLTVQGSINFSPPSGSMITGAVASGFGFAYRNGGMILWSDDPIPAGGRVRLSRFLTVPTGSNPIYPTKPQRSLDILSCEGFIEKTYAPDVPPGTVTSEGALILRGGDDYYWRYRQAKLYDNNGAAQTGNPSLGVTLYSPNTGAAGFAYDGTLAADVAATVNFEDHQGVNISNAAPVGNIIEVHAVANFGM